MFAGSPWFSLAHIIKLTSSIFATLFWEYFSGSTYVRIIFSKISISVLYRGKICFNLIVSLLVSLENHDAFHCVLFVYSVNKVPG